MEWKTLLSQKRSRELLTGVRKSAQPESDPRSQFDRDYGRAVFATSVRRLQDKAQVFPLEAHDAVRTRLTHSLEVSTLARSLARQVYQDLRSKKLMDEQQGEHIEIVCMTCGLLHDIGNPPFGHAGEAAIASYVEKLIGSDVTLTKALGKSDSQLVRDFGLFDGNAQTLRQVARLQMLSDDHGLNLTAGVLSALMKYIAPSNGIDKEDHARSKPGYFASEAKLVDLVRAETGTGIARNPLALLVEAADDIVNSSVDLEDGAKKGLLSWRQICEELTRRTNDDEVVRVVLAKTHEYLKGTESTLDASQAEEAHVQLFRTLAMYEHVREVCSAFMRNYDAIMTGTYAGDLISAGNSAPLYDACKGIAKDHLFRTSEVLKLELMGREVIEGLLRFFWNGAKSAPSNLKWRRSFDGKTYELISNNYRNVFERTVREDRSLPVEYHRLRLIVDYVCGMTDSFATTTHAALRIR